MHLPLNDRDNTSTIFHPTTIVFSDVMGARLEGQMTSASAPVEVAYNIQSDLNSIQASQSNLPYNL